MQKFVNRWLVLALFAFVLDAWLSIAQTLPGIPEPGLLQYGVVSNSNGGMLLPVGDVDWTFIGGGASNNVRSLIINVNSQYYYIAHVPFETRSVGAVSFAVSPNALPLTDSVITFTRSANVRGVRASIIPPAADSFSFLKTDRGKIERVDLAVASEGDPALDTDADGMSDFMEIIAGTDPYDPRSVFKVSTDIEAAEDGVITIKWASVADKTYAIYRSTNLSQGFTTLTTNLSSTPPQNRFSDFTAPGNGILFYRILVNPQP